MKTLKQHIKDNKSTIELLLSGAFNNSRSKLRTVDNEGNVMIDNIALTSLKLIEEDKNSNILGLIPVGYYEDFPQYENNRFCIHTDEFDYSEIEKSKFNSFFRFDNPELEYDNFINVAKISKTIFGNMVQENNTGKIYLVNNGTIEYVHWQSIGLDKDYGFNNGSYFGNYFELKYSGDKDIWSDDVLRNSIQYYIKRMTQIEFEIKDINPENLSEIGKQVQMILY